MFDLSFSRDHLGMMILHDTAMQIYILYNIEKVLTIVGKARLPINVHIPYL